jgi:xanthine dehydrogenase accessory factor
LSPRTTILERMEQLESARTPYVRATVVRAERPTSAKPGDAALVLADGRIEGFVGGACAESTVRAQALEVLAGGDSRLVRITPEPDPSAGERPGEVTVVNPCLSGGTLEVFLEPSVPSPLVVVFGDGPIARALEAASDRFGQQVVRHADPHAPLPPDASAVVVASHGRDEEPVLRAALEAAVPYVGLVASRRRGAAVVAGLDVDDALRTRVHTPAGLDIGARTPGEVALSILAEIVALRPRPEPPPQEATGRAAPGSGAAGASAAPTAVDPVCGMAVAAVDASIHADVGGERYWFCGPGCRDAFCDDPARYRS